MAECACTYLGSALGVVLSLVELQCGTSMHVSHTGGSHSHVVWTYSMCQSTFHSFKTKYQLRTSAHRRSRHRFEKGRVLTSSRPAASLTNDGRGAETACWRRTATELERGRAVGT
eukprot:7723-Eustigmatos_ZCMA.PRE.1